MEATHGPLDALANSSLQLTSAARRLLAGDQPDRREASEREALPALPCQSINPMMDPVPPLPVPRTHIHTYIHTYTHTRPAERNELVCLNAAVSAVAGRGEGGSSIVGGSDWVLVFSCPAKCFRWTGHGFLFHWPLGVVFEQNGYLDLMFRYLTDPEGLHSVSRDQRLNGGRR